MASSVHPAVPAGDAPRNVPGLLRRLMTEDAGRPRLTWYGPGGERIELSAKVLDNWVAKTANLLVDELDVGPGTTVAIALPAHWRTVTWLLATWATGACAIVVPADADGVVPDADVLVAADVGLLGASRAAATVAVALPALATRYGSHLPPGVLDAAPGVRAHGDVFVPFVLPDASDPALVVGPVTRSHGDLLPAASAAAAAARWPTGVRLLTGADPAQVIEVVLAPLMLSGSVVLHHDLRSLHGPARTALRLQEHVTHPPEDP